MSIKFLKNDLDNLFLVDEVLEKGTLFKGLYVPYKYEIPKISAVSDKAKLTLAIQQLSFIVQEIGLYMDCYPDNQKANELMKVACEELDSVVNYYEEKYHSLTNNNSSYAKTSFPWERLDV